MSKVIGVVPLALARSLPRPILRRWARGRALNGWLNERTRQLFRILWKRNQGSSDLLRLLRFERECGTVVPADLRVPLQRFCRSARGEDLWSAALFLLETDAEEVLSDRRDELARIPRPSPPIAAFLMENGAELAQQQQRLAGLHTAQARWREEFRRALANRSNSVCIVGNSAHLRGSGYGTLVDSHDIVIRFNKFGSGPNAEADLGNALDVWVCAYDYLERQDRFWRKPPTWLVLSGPDVRYRWRTWRMVDRALQQGAKVLTIPYASWIPLVERLQAPASAGILMLQWLIDMLGDPATINVAGFQPLWPNSSAQYHYRTPRHRAGRRHNWLGEREILIEWSQRGLRFIDRDLWSAAGRKEPT